MIKHYRGQSDQIRRLYDRLEGYLRKETSPEETARSREEKWKTAEEIAAWWKQETGEAIEPRELDRALLEYWYDHQDERSTLKVRPAKYPNRATTTRLWGLTDDKYRGRGPDDLAQDLAADPVEFERTKAPFKYQAFLSHASVDVHFAARIRLFLAQHGVKAWLAEESLPRGNSLAEGIEEALHRSNFALLALSSRALGSPWIETEEETARTQRGLPLLIVIDVFDSSLMRLLQNWTPAKTEEQESVYRPQDLDAIKEINPRLVDPNKRAAADRFLKKLHRLPRCFYPSRLLSWRNGDKGFDDFLQALDLFLGRLNQD